VAAPVRSTAPVRLRPPLTDADLGMLEPARAAYDRFAELPVGDDVALASHVEATLT
jgi:hypothetical protein